MGFFISIAEILDKKFFYRKMLMKHNVFDLVRAAKATATNKANNSVFPSLKESIDR